MMAGAQDRGCPETPAAGNTREGTARRVLVRAAIVAVVPIALIAILYVVMFLDTNSLMRYMRGVSNGDMSLGETVGKPENIYNPLSYSDNPQVTSKLQRVFVLHNYSDGYIWVRYSQAIRNQNSELLSDSPGIPSLWRIHKDESGWHIVDIDERP
ncbi:MAG: hypothetical protein LBP24_02470 [Coriobacteriales bacterium]|jgi:hypothetical protein|nr:hypothetical protein [Coriobacteriales bacterium]